VASPYGEGAGCHCKGIALKVYEAVEIGELMSRRLFDDDGSWSSEGRRLNRELRSALEGGLADEEEGGEIDLRDFHFVAVSVVGEIVSRKSILRRLS